VVVDRRLFVLAAILWLAIAACAQGPPDTTGAERDSLEQRQNDFLAALADRDLDRTIEHYARDAILHVANMPAIEGRDAIQQFYGNVFRFMVASEATVDRVRMSSDGEMAYSVGRTSNVFQGAQGPEENTGKFLLVWERLDGDWSVVLYAISNDSV
jgi:ketosteroid isomerase-like protein